MHSIPDQIPPRDALDQVSEKAWSPALRVMVIFLVVGLFFAVPAGLYFLWIESVKGSIAAGAVTLYWGASLRYFQNRLANKDAFFMSTSRVRPTDSFNRKRLFDLFVAAVSFLILFFLVLSAADLVG